MAEETQPPVIELKLRCGTVNLRRINLATYDKMAFWLETPDEPDIIASALWRAGVLWLWHSGEGWYKLDVSALRQWPFAENLPLILLPPGMNIDDAPTASAYGTMRCHEIPLTNQEH